MLNGNASDEFGGNFAYRKRYLGGIFDQGFAFSEKVEEMIEMIERVARALSVVGGADPDALVDKFKVTDLGRLGMAASATGELEPAWARHVVDARAAIEAMREPTDAMAKSGERAFWDEQNVGAHEVWRCWENMIDKALDA